MSSNRQGPFRDLREFLIKVASSVQATECAAFSAQGDLTPPDLSVLAHVRSGEADAKTLEAAVAAFKDIISPCAVQRKDAAVRIITDESSDDHQYCLVVLARQEKTIVGAAAFIVSCKSTEEAQMRLLQIQAFGYGL